MQKNLLGEQLYPRVGALLQDRSQVGKITGMLLEMDNSEIMVLLESEALLQQQVEEAVRLLQEEAITRLPDMPCPEEPAPRAVALGAVAKRGVVGDLDGAEYVQQGLTLPSPLLAQATLEGRRLVDSRAWRIPCGWYALHADTKPVPAEWEEALRACWPDAPQPGAMRGGIVGGLVYFEEQQQHLSERCEGDVWARGAVHNVISKVIQLPQPVRCAGAAGLWPLPESVCEQLLWQLPELAITYYERGRPPEPAVTYYERGR